jgi:glycosyltransferase involved in cell wall biosynthesis
LLSKSIFATNKTPVTLKIAVNTRLLLKNKLDGIGRFSYETLSRITKGQPDYEFIFIFDRPYAPEFVFSENVIPIVASPQARHPFLYYTWLEYSLPRVFKQFKPDLFLSPDGFLSLSTNIPSIPVIHDINFYHRPKDLPILTRKYYNYYFPKFAHKAERIVTVSEYSKKDISEVYGIASKKIDVVYNGAAEHFRPLTEKEKNNVKQKYTQGEDYFVFVGSLHPRKNVASLLLAYDDFRRRVADSNTKLVIVGNKMFHTSDIEEVFNKMQFSDDVIFTGRVSDNELYRIVAGAYALTFVPFFEGFGIPIIEAMYCDVPVITSNTTSMPEVSGNAALLVDPYSVKSISAGLSLVYRDKKFRQDIIEKARLQRTNFSWTRTTDGLWHSIEKCM